MPTSSRRRDSRSERAPLISFSTEAVLSATPSIRPMTAAGASSTLARYRGITYTSISLEMSVKRLTRPRATTLRPMPRVKARRQRGPDCGGVDEAAEADGWVGLISKTSLAASAPLSRAPAARARKPGRGVQLANLARIEIVDVTAEARFGLVPPCADPAFDHRTCDYWEEADRGSKAYRPGWIPTGLKSSATASSTGSVDHSASANPFALPPKTESNPFAPAPKAGANPFAPAPTARPRNCLLYTSDAA